MAAAGSACPANAVPRLGEAGRPVRRTRPTGLTSLDSQRQVTSRPFIRPFLPIPMTRPNGPAILRKIPPGMSPEKTREIRRKTIRRAMMTRTAFPTGMKMK